VTPAPNHTNADTRVAFLGLGRMGSRMARNLGEAGFAVSVWNRTREVAEKLAATAPVSPAASAADAVAGAEVVVSMLADDAAVEHVYLDAESVRSRLQPGTVVADCSTVAPATARLVAQALSTAGVGFVDAPVSGSTATVENRALTIMAGGENTHVERVRPVLEATAGGFHHLGPVGAGATMKLAVNAVVFGLNASLAEALVLAERAGIDRSRAYDVFENSAIAAPVVRYRRAAFENPGETEVSFRLGLAVKDLELITALAEEVGARVPQSRRNLELHRDAVNDGLADADLAGVAEWLRTDP
jgi:3-hydroxyisobutyrate dehydrogenase-like beta-hydroxyacid dehydrogenase